MNAADLRQHLAICFQPAVTSDPAMLTLVVAALAEDLVHVGVSEKRVRNAAERVALNTEWLDALLAAMKEAT